MSNLVFPVLRGLEWDVERDVMFNTTIQKAKSGREVRIAEQQIPLRKWTMSASVLDRSKIQAGQTYDDFARLEGFYMQLLGAYDSFLYEDPTDCTLTAENIGTGDGSTTAFQVTRNMGGYKEAVYEIESSPVLQVFRSDWQGNQLMYATARTNQLLQSEVFGNASWTKDAGVTVTDNNQTDPIGTSLADTVACTTAANGVRQTTALAAANGTPVTLSVWVKAAGAGTLTLLIDRGAGLDAESAVVNVTTGWNRVSFSHSATWTGTTAIRVSILPTGASQTFFAFAAQLETGATLTSYISTVAATVTRTDYTISSTAVITFAVAPLNAAAITVTGKYYFRCRFYDEDMTGMLTLNNFINNFWEAKTIVFIQVKP